MTFADTLDYAAIADRYGILGVLSALFVIALFKRWIVMGYQLRDAEKREADWKDMALRGTTIAERITTPRRSIEERLEALERRPDG